MGNLASTYRSREWYTQAIELGREALEIRKRVLKLDHPHIATSMRNLALSYQGKELHKEAAELHDQALRIRQRVLGPAHPDTLISRGDLANALRAIGSDEEAVKEALRLAGPSSGAV
jgi:tetratricopeptide (TPR) repeat protein